MDFSKCVDLLIVDSGRGFHVVEAPGYKANVGNLITYCVDGVECIGTVTDKMWCQKGEEEYRCMAKVNPIYPAKAIYNRTWQADACEDKTKEE